VDQVTQRNATAAEELTASAAALQAQAEMLLKLVGRFKVSGVRFARAFEGPAPAALPSPR
jgi:methyl-accepting chemotaxis protein